MVRAAGDEGQRFIDNACQAHAMIDDYELEQGTKCMNLKVTFNILAATDPAQNGKSMNQIFPLEGGGVSKLWDLLEASRLVPRGTNRKAGVDFDETQLKGRQVYLTIHLEQGQTLNTTTGKYDDDPSKPKYARIGFNSICDVRDQKVATLPKDPQFLAVWPELPGGPQGGASGAPQTQAPPPPAGPAQQGLPLTGPQNPPPPPSMNW